MSNSEKSDCIHLVISTRECQDPLVLNDMLLSNKNLHQYIISVESGKTGHKHIECFVTFTRAYRKDKFKESIIKLYDISSQIEKKNVKVTFNKIDSDVRYGFGYAWKESPKVYYTNLSIEYLDECLEYFKSQEEVVKKALDKSNTSKKRYMDIDDVAKQYYEFVKEYQSCLIDTTVSVSYEMPVLFRKFFCAIEEEIPFSLYQKINHQKLVDYVNAMIMRDFVKNGGRSLDSTPL